MKSPAAIPATRRRILDAALRLVARHGGGEVAAAQARMNPGIWPLARAFDSVRRQDDAAERSWQERLAHRLEGCRAIVARLEACKICVGPWHVSVHRHHLCSTRR